MLQLRDSFVGDQGIIARDLPLRNLIRLVHGTVILWHLCVIPEIPAVT
jgi:hypothetical protein